LIGPRKAGKLDTPESWTPERWTPIKADAGRQRKAYGYDEADRLTSAQTTANGAQAFTHDLTGNRKSHTIDAVTETLVIAPTSNRISGISGYANEERKDRDRHHSGPVPIPICSRDKSAIHES